MSSRLFSIFNSKQNDEALHADIFPASKVVRNGIILQTEETYKAEIAGLHCVVIREVNGMAVVHVWKTDSRGCEKLQGPYTLPSKDIVTRE